MNNSNPDETRPLQGQELIKESDQLLKELGWNVAQARKHLLEVCNKKSRYLLDANEWAEYLQDLRFVNVYSRAFPSYKEKDLLTLLKAEYSRLGWDTKTQTIELMKRYHGKMRPDSLTPDQLRAYINYLHSLPVEGNANKKDDQIDRHYYH